MCHPPIAMGISLTSFEVPGCKLVLVLLMMRAKKDERQIAHHLGFDFDSISNNKSCHNPDIVQFSSVFSLFHINQQQ
jgi:hypothetical protein